ncbi:hypothetical protein DL96DRAFT_1598670 [Flagelloscypha sp. PMI_526]|nr:hypothetical protein DL96DRAFT_1598670 [Flagelloscypha sp. PMI_526]
MVSRNGTEWLPAQQPAYTFCATKECGCIVTTAREQCEKCHLLKQLLGKRKRRRLEGPTQYSPLHSTAHAPVLPNTTSVILNSPISQLTPSRIPLPPASSPSEDEESVNTELVYPLSTPQNQAQPEFPTSNDDEEDELQYPPTTEEEQLQLQHQLTPTFGPPQCSANGCTNVLPEASPLKSCLDCVHKRWSAARQGAFIREKGKRNVTFAKTHEEKTFTLSDSNSELTDLTTGEECECDSESEAKLVTTGLKLRLPYFAPSSRKYAKDSDLEEIESKSPSTLPMKFGPPMRRKKTAYPAKFGPPKGKKKIREGAIQFPGPPLPQATSVNIDNDESALGPAYSLPDDQALQPVAHHSLLSPSITFSKKKNMAEVSAPLAQKLSENSLTAPMPLEVPLSSVGSQSTASSSVTPASSANPVVRTSQPLRLLSVSHERHPDLGTKKVKTLTRPLAQVTRSLRFLSVPEHESFPSGTKGLRPPPFIPTSQNPPDEVDVSPVAKRSNLHPLCRSRLALSIERGTDRTPIPDKPHPIKSLKASPPVNLPLVTLSATPSTSSNMLTDQMRHVFSVTIGDNNELVSERKCGRLKEYDTSLPKRPVGRPKKDSNHPRDLAGQPPTPSASPRKHNVLKKGPSPTMWSTRQPTPYPEFQSFEALIRDFEVRLAAWTTSLALWVAFRGSLDSNKRVSYSVVALDYNLRDKKRKEQLEMFIHGTGKNAVAEVLMKNGVFRFGKDEWTLSLLTGGIVTKFNCFHKSPVIIPAWLAKGKQATHVGMVPMRGELEIAVLPDMSHPAFPGQRTVIRYMMVGL